MVVQTVGIVDECGVGLCPTFFIYIQLYIVKIEMNTNKFKGEVN